MAADPDAGDRPPDPDTDAGRSGRDGDPAETAAAGPTERRERAFAAFAERVLDALGDRVHDVILYGSVARGEATPESDVDVLVVVHGSPDADPIYEAAFWVGVDYGVGINPTIQSRNRVLDRRDHPFFKSVFREGRSYG